MKRDGGGGSTDKSLERRRGMVSTRNLRAVSFSENCLSYLLLQNKSP